MARLCSICSHPRVSEIDAALLGKEAYRKVAQNFDASESSVYRHSKEHLPVVSASSSVNPSCAGEELTAEVSSAATSYPDQPGKADVNGKESVDLLGYMVHIQQRTLAILESASTGGRHETALKAIRETRGNIELISKLEGLLADGGNMLDLHRLSVEQVGSLLRASMGELSVCDRQTLLLEAPELADLVPDQFGPRAEGEGLAPNPER